MRGIGEALGQAHKAVEGDIAGVTQSLGVAFNSTFIALLISIVLMFLLHQLQLQQERLVLDTGTYLDRYLIRHLRVPAGPGRPRAVALLALELHDAGILAKREGQCEAPRSSPGYVMVDGDRLLAGEAARESSRMRPRHVDSRFWSELDTRPLAAPFSGEVSRADLAHAHLESVWCEARSGIDGAILVLPGSFTDDQLGLILGIARACGIPVEGLVDSAVAACPAEPPDAQLLHLDLHLHRAVVTQLSRGAELTRREVRTVQDLGSAAFQEAWIRRIAERFVRDTRFDPLHDARTEQALYDSLPQLLRDLRTAERAAITVEASGTTHAVELSRAELVTAVDDRLGAVARLVGSLATRRPTHDRSAVAPLRRASRVGRPAGRRRHDDPLARRRG